MTTEQKTKLANEIKKLFRNTKLYPDYGLFYNGIMDSWKLEKDSNGLYRYKKEILKSINPCNYSHYFSTNNFIMGMWFDGDIYKLMYGRTHINAKNKLIDLLDSYGLIISFVDSFHAEFITKGVYKNEY